MSDKELATFIVEKILTHVDEHLRRYGQGTYDEEAKKEAIAMVTKIIAQDRAYLL